MNTIDDLGQRLADHYAAEAPARAPGWALERLLTAVETTPQRRTPFGRPWRTVGTPWTLARMGVAAVAIAAIGIVGLSIVRQPAVGPAAPTSASVSPSASPPVSLRPSSLPGSSRFVSGANSLAIDYPSGWQIRRATEPWTSGTLDFDSPAADVIYDPAFGDRLYLALASRPLSAVRDDASDGLDKAPVLCEDGEGGSFGSDTVDGARAFFVHRCGGSAVEITTDARDYLIALIAKDEETGLHGKDGWGWFNSVVATVDLRPDTAVDQGLRSEGPAASTSPSASSPSSPSSPSPSTVLIARGSFVEHDFGPVEFEASRTGSSVTGRMTIAGTDGRAPTTVDLQCVRETEDGLVMIGGVIAGAGDQARPGGTPAWIALKRGSPEGGVGVGFLDGYPQTNDCLTYLDTWLRDAGQLSGEGATLTHQRAGTVEFGP